MITQSNNWNDVVAMPDAVVAFTATWCAPCRGLKGQLGRVATISPDLPLVIVDVDLVEPDVLHKFAISSVPTVLVTKAGEKVREVKSRNATEILKEVADVGAAS